MKYALGNIFRVLETMSDTRLPIQPLSESQALKDGQAAAHTK
jgi:hypothetical protein